MAAKKGTVRRITDEEQSLITVVRDRGTVSLVEAFNAACRVLQESGEVDARSTLVVLNELRYALSPSVFLSLKDWVDRGSLTQQDSNRILHALHSCKSIVIKSSDSSTSKDFLRTLLYEDSPTYATLILDTLGELKFIQEELKDRSLFYTNPGDVRTDEFHSLLKRKHGYTKCVLPDLSSDYAMFLFDILKLNSYAILAVVDSDSANYTRLRSSYADPTLWLECTVSTDGTHKIIISDNIINSSEDITL